MSRTANLLVFSLTVLAFCSRVAAQDENEAPSPAPDQAATQVWAIHGQITNIWQYHPAFRSLFQGTNSLDHHDHVNETFDATAFVGFALWSGAEFWIDPELDQGIAPSDTLGAAGYVNGDGAKVGHKHPYVRFQRVFVRQTINLGGHSDNVEPDANQLGEMRSSNRIVFTVGKINVTDIFDANKFAHDPKTDFLNWALIDTGSFDYAADAWGYSEGGAVEWYQGSWTTRLGFFDLSVVPNSELLDTRFHQFQLDGESELRYSIFDNDGKIELTAFLSRGRMGSFSDALRLAQREDTIANTADVRRYRSRVGLAANAEQSLTKSVGVFVRAGIDQDNVEPYEYSDIDRTVAGGISISGDLWERNDDTIGLAGITDWIGKEHEEYLNAGGLGILVGDGKLPRPGPERIAEVYYNLSVTENVHLTTDVQVLFDPAYNRARGPVPVLSERGHFEF